MDGLKQMQRVVAHFMCLVMFSNCHIPRNILIVPDHVQIYHPSVPGDRTGDGKGILYHFYHHCKVALFHASISLTIWPWGGTPSIQDCVKCGANGPRWCPSTSNLAPQPQEVWLLLLSSFAVFYQKQLEMDPLQLRKKLKLNFIEI